MCNACYHEVQYNLFSRRVSENVKEKRGFISCFVHMWNLVSHVMGIRQFDLVWEQGALKNFWTQRG